MVKNLGYKGRYTDGKPWAGERRAPGVFEAEVNRGQQGSTGVCQVSGFSCSPLWADR